jgi:hypothetical protein
MAKRRSAELDKEIREALARIPKTSRIRTREQIDAILTGGLPAERHEIAGARRFSYPKKSPPKTMKLAGTNLFALTKMDKLGPRSRR